MIRDYWLSHNGGDLTTHRTVQVGGATLHRYEEIDARHYLVYDPARDLFDVLDRAEDRLLGLTIERTAAERPWRVRTGRTVACADFDNAYRKVADHCRRLSAAPSAAPKAVG